MKKNNKINGFTILELIITLALFAIVAFSFLLIFSMGMTTMVRSGVKEDAVVKAASDIYWYNTDSETTEVFVEVETKPNPINISVLYVGDTKSNTFTGVEFYVTKKSEYKTTDDQYSTMRGFK